MKNLTNIDDEVVETLPIRDRVRPPDGWRRHGRDFPRSKVNRFLLSRQGKLWDNVFSEYVHLDWVPKQYRTEDEISSFVLLHTFMKDGKVWFFDKYSTTEKAVEDYRYGGDNFYRHPETKKLCYLQKHKVDYSQRQKEEEAKYMMILGDYHQLLKVAGIWFEVKGEPTKSETIKIDGLHYRPAGVRLATDITPRHTTDYRVVDGKLYVPFADSRYDGKPLGPKECLLEDLTKRGYYWNRHNYHSVKITMYRQLNSKDLKKHGLKNDRKLATGIKCKKCGGYD